MNKVLAILLPLLWLVHILCLSEIDFLYKHQVDFLVRIMLGACIGYSIVYLWTYHDFRNIIYSFMVKKNDSCNNIKSEHE